MENNNNSEQINQEQDQHQPQQQQIQSDENTQHNVKVQQKSQNDNTQQQQQKKEGDIEVMIHVCQDCKNHQISTRHDETKYNGTFEKCKQVIEATIPGTFCVKERGDIGDFLVTVDGEIVYDKKFTQMFPNASVLADRMKSFLEDKKNGKDTSKYAIMKDPSPVKSKKKSQGFDAAKTYGLWYVQMQEAQRLEEEKRIKKLQEEEERRIQREQEEEEERIRLEREEEERIRQEEEDEKRRQEEEAAEAERQRIAAEEEAKRKQQEEEERQKREAELLEQQQQQQQDGEQNAEEGQQQTSGENPIPAKQ